MSTTTKPIVYRTDAEGTPTLMLTGRFPVVLVYPKFGSAKQRAQFLKQVDYRACQAEACEWGSVLTDDDGEPVATAYRVWGAADALERLLKDGTVVRWEFDNPVRVPRGMGSDGPTHDHIRPDGAGAKRTCSYGRTNKVGKAVIRHRELNPEVRRAELAAEPGKKAVHVLPKSFRTKDAEAAIQRRVNRNRLAVVITNIFLAAMEAA